jgi:flagellar hook protein FlgE
MSILNTSVSGMLGDSNWLSSISPNVANANTTGYKDLETNFEAVVDSVSSAAPGGGVTTSLTSLNIAQGNLVSTTTSTNLAVQGAGYFVVSNSSGAMFLTRDGSFTPDASGNLVNDTFQNALASQATSALSNATGVNLDAQLTNMLNLENSYASSAKLLTTVTSMYSALLAAA